MNEAELKEANPSEILYEYCEQNKIWHFEGDSGLRNLNQLTKNMGYGGHGFKYGSSLEEFLSDNPGAQTAIMEWIGENINEEQVENLANEIELDETDEEEQTRRDEKNGLYAGKEDIAN
jgi:hypothetical protein